MTGALQWRPSDRTEAVLDVLWSRFNSELESPNIEAWSFSRANVNSVVVRDYAIDADKNTIDLLVSESELNTRRAAWKRPPYKATRGTLYKYIKNVKSASEGCVTDE